MCLYGLALFIIPGIYIFTKYYFSTMASLLEGWDTGPIKYSAALIKGDFLQVLFLILFTQLPINIGLTYIDYLFLIKIVDPITFIVFVWFLLMLYPFVPAISYTLYDYMRENKKNDIKPLEIKPMNIALSVLICFFTGIITLLILAFPHGGAMLFIAPNAVLFHGIAKLFNLTH
jgi:hypothetical protein